MRLVMVNPKSHKVLVLCDRSIVKQVRSDSNIGPRVGDSILSHAQKFIGLVSSWDDAMNKFPQYFL